MLTKQIKYGKRSYNIYLVVRINALHGFICDDYSGKNIGREQEDGGRNLEMGPEKAKED